MKNAIRFGVALVVLVVALTSCTLYNAINVGWTLGTLTIVSGVSTTIPYTATNLGKYDLTGVNLQFTVDYNNDGYFDPQAPYLEPSLWTPDFDLPQGGSHSGTITIYYSGGLGGFAAVTGVDMDKP